MHQTLPVTQKNLVSYLGGTDSEINGNVAHDAQATAASTTRNRISCSNKPTGLAHSPKKDCECRSPTDSKVERMMSRLDAVLPAGFEILL